MTDATAAGASAGPAFAHASEAELARILDFYDVRWAYEPHTFPIGWNLDGEVVESFSPDFFLPDLDLYIELTTLKQKLVRKKNRKLRRLRELYPGVRIKLFYARDFRMLLLKFGRLALADELSGTTGQATPARGEVPGTAAGDAAPGAPELAAGSEQEDHAEVAVRETLGTMPVRARRRPRRRRRRAGAAGSGLPGAVPAAADDPA